MPSATFAGSDGFMASPSRWGRGLRVGAAAGGQRQVPLLAGPLQQPADLAVHPAQVVQQPIAELAHLVGLLHHRRPLLVHLAADLLGHLPSLPQHVVGTVHPGGCAAASRRRYRPSERTR